MQGRCIARRVGIAVLLGVSTGCLGACAGAAESDRETGQLPATGGTAGMDDTSPGDDDDGVATAASTGSDDAGPGDSADDDDGDTTGCVEQSFFLDADGDDHGDPLAEVVSCVAPAGHVPGGDDCDDADPTNAPSLTEICDSKDNDCDGMIDEPPAATDCQGCAAASNGTTTYYFCSDPLTFDAARTLCMGLNGDLLKVDDQAELDFLAGAGIPPSAGVGGYFNGLNDLATEGTFLWTDGTAPAIAPWNAGEPNDAGGIEDCVEMTLTADAWNDITCAEPRAFVCESG